MKPYIRFVQTFFQFFGSQNDYLYPTTERQRKEMIHPFDKPHLWKTRMGFRTCWGIAKICM